MNASVLANYITEILTQVFLISDHICMKSANLYNVANLTKSAVFRIAESPIKMVMNFPTRIAHSRSLIP